MMSPIKTTRADLHCHSTASEFSKLGIQRSLGLPECATPPEEVYELAKRRGMDLVTITDHDTIDGCLQIADRPDVFISEELTCWFPGSRRRSTCSASGSPPTTTSGSRPTTRTSSGAPSTSTRTASPARWPIPSTRSRPRSRRRTAAGWRASSRSGRRATARGRVSSTCPRPSTSRRTVEPAPAARTITPAWTSGGRSPRRPPLTRRNSFCATSARAAPRRTATREARPSGRTRRWRSAPAR